MMQGLKHLYTGWFNQHNKASNYRAFKALHYQRLHELIAKTSIKTGEEALLLVGKLKGEIALFDQIEVQYKMCVLEGAKRN